MRGALTLLLLLAAGYAGVVDGFFVPQAGFTRRLPSRALRAAIDPIRFVKLASAKTRAMTLSKFRAQVPGAGVSVTLDRPPIPQSYGVMPFLQTLLSFTGAVLIFVLIGQLMVTTFLPSLSKGIVNFFEARGITQFNTLRYKYRVARGKWQTMMDELKHWWENTVAPKDYKIIPANSYPVLCTLEERISLGSGFVRYKFRLPEPDLVMGLDLGQQVSILGPNPEDRLVRANFVPISDPYQPGYIEIVGEKNSVDDPFTKILDRIAIGDQVQMTRGKALTNHHPGPITDLLIISSKLGVIPTIQFLKMLLPKSPYTVDTAKVVWVNEKEEHYILQAELEDLFYKYNKKLDVYAIVEKDVFMVDLSTNEQFVKAIPAPNKGLMIVVAGPEYFVAKVIDYLKESGHPEDIIVSV